MLEKGEDVKCTAAKARDRAHNWYGPCSFGAGTKILIEVAAFFLGLTPK
jgi:hypothetical protein